MPRNKGIASFSANFEPQVGAPLDGRLTVATLADLTTASTWLANDGLPYTYLGMLVSVTNDGANNGVYRLNAIDCTQPSSWVALGGVVSLTIDCGEFLPI